MNEHAATTTRSATPPAASLDTSPPAVIARNLNDLFNLNKRLDGSKITNQEVASYVTRATGQTCHRTWIARLRGAKLTAPDLVRLDAVAAFFGHTRADLVSANGHHETSDHLCELASLAERLEAHGVNLTQLASLNPADIQLVSTLVRRLADNQTPWSDPA